MLREKRSYGYEQMEKDELCETAWETSKERGPACRVYSVTDTGEAYLELWAQGCEKYLQILDSFYLAYSNNSDGAAAGGT